MDSERKIRLLGAEIDPKTIAVVGLGATLFGYYVLHNAPVCLGGVVLIMSANTFSTSKSEK